MATTPKEINEILDALKKIQDLVQTKEGVSKSVSQDRTSVLELTLEELRIIYGRLDSSLSTAKSRILTFLGAALAIMSYLYGGGDLFIPSETYGKVFYFIGLGLMISSISLLIHALRPAYWAVPIESKLTKIRRNNTKLQLLELLAEEYIECMVGNIGRYESKVTYLNTAFFQLLCGGILLLVIKSLA